MDNENQIKLEVIHKEIDLIQSCISRMASNSFFLKGWLITLVAVVLAMMSKKNNTILSACLILTFIVGCFWYLDAFFLRLEKMYRELYNWVLIERPQGNVNKLYDLNPHRFSNKIKFWKVFFSNTLIFFYGMPLVLIVCILLYCSLIKHVQLIL